MIPWHIVGGLVGSAALLVVVALVLRGFGSLNKGVPLPAVGAIAVILLGGGIAYVVSTLREPPREKREESKAPSGMANMSAMMGQGGGMRRDTIRPLVELVHKLGAAAGAGELDLSGAQRTDLAARLREVATSERLGMVDASILGSTIQHIFTDEQWQQVQDIRIERPDPEVNYITSDAAYPFASGVTREKLDALIGWLEAGGN